MKYTDVRNISETEFSEFWNLYESAFPKNERRPREMFAETLLSPEFHPLKITADDGEFLGLFCIWKFEKYVYGEHLAILPEKRNSGLGAEIFRDVMQNIVRERRFVFEVEKPENELAARRINFYQRLGCMMNKWYYMQPPYKLELKGLELLLMSYPSTLSEIDFCDYLDNAYLRSYALAFKYYDLNIVVAGMKEKNGFTNNNC